MTCDGKAGLGPCEKTAKYDVMPLWVTLRKVKNPPVSHACGIHLQQVTTAMLAAEGPVVVSEKEN